MVGVLRQKVIAAHELMSGYEDKRVCIACSFGKDSMVVVDLARRFQHFDVISVLSDTEFKAVGWLVHTVPKAKIHRFSNDPDDCCGRAKVDATRKALEPYDVWITGLRNTEGITRGEFKWVERGPPVKVNPILDWTEAEVWRYTALRNLPVNPHYWDCRSLGCVNCSSAEEAGDSERSGRWRGEEREECGIHTEVMR